MNFLDVFKTMRWSLYFTGGVSVVLGLWALTYPVEALMSLAFFLGVGFILSGLNLLVPCFSLRGCPEYPRWLPFWSVADLLLGFLMLTRLGLTAFMIPVFLAVWLFFIGLVRIWGAFSVRRMGARGWWRMLLNGVLMLLAAAIMLSSPFLGVVSVGTVLGGLLVFKGLLVLSEGWFIFRR
ncbi:MAG: hypothetical protein GX256_05680 [Fretibacterium sp.]|nr:hypothetical protein [Fretibacterium sp.]